MCHFPGLWNGIWSDMSIETTFMRYGHDKQGIIGVTLKPETIKVWSLSLHIYKIFQLFSIQTMTQSLLDIKRNPRGG